MKVIGRTEFTVKISSAAMPSSCWGRYCHVAVIEHDVGDYPATISERARGTVRVVASWRRQHVGTTPRCALSRAERAAAKMAARLNAARHADYADLLLQAAEAALGAAEVDAAYVLAGSVLGDRNHAAVSGLLDALGASVTDLAAALMASRGSRARRVRVAAEQAALTVRAAAGAGALIDEIAAADAAREEALATSRRAARDAAISAAARDEALYGIAGASQAWLEVDA
ncbi:MAG: hypothetical protein WC700_17555 [Gemmatimonadaceae bacterium]|jgi:hypothetical protein